MKIDKPGLRTRQETSGGFRKDWLLLPTIELENEKMRQACDRVLPDRKSAASRNTSTGRLVHGLVGLRLFGGNLCCRRTHARSWSFRERGRTQFKSVEEWSNSRVHLDALKPQDLI